MPLAAYSPSTSEDAALADLLKKLKNYPVGSDLKERDLQAVYDYLITKDPKPEHWFCEEAPSTLVPDAAAFTLRLHAYNGVQANKWKSALAEIVSRCSVCAQGMEDRLLDCQVTYMSAFRAHNVRDWLDCCHCWDANDILQHLAKLDSHPQSTLSDLPPSVSFRIFYNTVNLSNEKILAALVDRLPKNRIHGWPPIIPAGLLLLLFHRLSLVREWARNQTMALPPLTQAAFAKPYPTHYNLVINALVEAIISSAGRPSSVVLPSSSFHTLLDNLATSLLWNQVLILLPTLPPQVYSFSSTSGVSLFHVVVNNLRGSESMFPTILRAFHLLLKRGCSNIWTQEPADFPRVTLDSIKDNPAFERMIINESDSDADPFEWVQAFVGSIWTSAVFEDTLARLVGFMGEELQHERFGDTRPQILTRLFSTLISAQTKAIAESSTAQRRAIAKSISVHIEMILLRAFGKVYSTPSWSPARVAARQVLFKLLDAEVDQVHEILLELPGVAEQKDKDTAGLQLAGSTGHLWKRVRAAILPSDSDATRVLVILTARSVFFTPVLPARFNTKVDGDEGGVSKLVEALKPMNKNVTQVHDGLKDTLVAFAESNSASVLKRFCEQSGVAEAVLMLIMAPTPELSNGAQAVVSQAYDVDTRADCLRALLEHHPSEAFEGLERYLARFEEVVGGYLEACAPSMALVRCFTDVLDALSNRTDGLLFDLGFTVKHPKTIRRLPALWKRMCTAISSIIRLCPTWSRRWPAEEMVLWMRDALIFARELLPQRRVIESAAVVASNPSSTSRLSDSPGKLSNSGIGMVQDLQSVLRSVLEWLRLTDMELLYQAYTLMMDLFDAFRETRIPPLKGTLADVRRYVESQLEKKKARADIVSKLTTAQLENILGKVEEWDEEVLVPPSVPVFDKAKEKPDESERDFIVVEGSTSDDDVLLVGERSRKKPIKTQRTPALKSKKELPKLSAPKSVPPLVSKPKKHLSALDRIRQQATAQSWQFQKEERDQRKRSETREGILPDPFVGSKSMAPLPVAASKGPSTTSATSSSEESSSDEEETGADKSALGSLAAFHKSPKKTTKQQRRGVIFDFKRPTFGSNSVATKAQEDSRSVLPRQRPRYVPDLQPLHRAILSWNYDHDGPTPSFKDRPPELLRVPNVFRGHAHYLDVFHPLLLIECWNALIKSKNENMDVVEIRVSGRLYADMWVEINVSLTGSRPQGWSLSDTDIVLLKHPSGKSVLAKVHATNRQRDNMGATLRYYADLPNDIDRTMAIDSVWNLSKIYSLATIHREYIALMGLPYYHAFDIIMHPTLSPLPIISESDVRQAMEGHKLNHPQARAVLSALGTKGFSLIQGPPGTGKTSTICGLVGAFMSNRRTTPTVISIGRNAGKPAEKGPVPKVLICAPSNAAIDEVAKRIKEGVWNSAGKSVTPQVVRVGADASVNIAVKDISLDALVEQRLATRPESQRQEKPERQSVLQEIQNLKEQRKKKQEQIGAAAGNSARVQQLEQEIKEVNAKRMTLSARANELRQQDTNAQRALDTVRRKAKFDILNEADVICCTLSGSGHEALDGHQFDMVIIDEAAQAVELSSLIPLKFQSERCVMVGDPQQLPPTVLSPLATDYGYNQSLFVRLQRARPKDVHLLSVQYRMHPTISRLPSVLFYEGRLEDGPGMEQKTVQPWHQSQIFGVYKFYDIRGTESRADKGHSQYNQEEVRCALALYARLRSEFPAVNFDYRIGVIAMYRGQLTMLKNAFKERYGQSIWSRIDFNTVDGFQGQEKDIIILSCVRAGTSLNTIGFLADPRRVNVSITRSRSSLYILGHAATLERSDELWKGIVADARTRNLLVSATPATFRVQPSLSQPVPLISRTSSRKLMIAESLAKDDGYKTPKELIAAAKAAKSKTAFPSTNAMDIDSKHPLHDPPSLSTNHTSTDTSSNVPVPLISTALITPTNASGSGPPPIPNDGARKKRPPVPVKRPAPTANLFIPKKRPLPSGSAGPDPKRRPPNPTT